MVIPVILSGGTGSRLWPLSRGDFPKQFLPLINEDSLFQSTVVRAKDILGDYEQMIIISHQEHQYIAQQQLTALDNHKYQLLLEPCAKNTAPAITIAALHLLEKHGDLPMWIMPADHVINHHQNLIISIQQATEAALMGYVVCFGITPTYPSEAYGYIKANVAKSDSVYQKIEEFIEKPKKDIAEEMIRTGQHLWNSGMFMVKPSVLLKELKTHHPKLLNLLDQCYSQAQQNNNVFLFPAEQYQQIEPISIDYSIMEKTQNSVVIPCEITWNDVGSWESLMTELPADRQKNVITGNVMTENVENSIIHASDRVVAAIGLKNHIVVETADAVLISEKSQSQKVKGIVERLIAEGNDVATKNLKCYRPWGSYETLIKGSRFRVKHIYVNPGASLSLQKHMHRAEHWVIVAGTAEIQRGNETMVLTENQSNYIPIGEIHRLSNIGKIPLEVIEVQTGSYLEEDDIIRLDDIYGRNEPATPDHMDIKDNVL